MFAPKQVWVTKTNKDGPKIKKLAVGILCELVNYLPHHKEEIKENGDTPKEAFLRWINKRSVTFIVRQEGKKKAGCFIQCTKKLFEVMYVYKTKYEERHLIAEGVFILLRDAFNANRIKKDTVFQIGLDEGSTEKYKLRSRRREQEAKQKADKIRKKKLMAWYSKLFGVEFPPNGLNGKSTCGAVSEHLRKRYPEFG